MHLVYIDDSKDERHVGFSALSIPADQWHECLTHLVEMRRQMRALEGIYFNRELHATDWIGGRGQVAPFVVKKGTRARLFNFVLSAGALLPGALLFNAFGSRRSEMLLFERLLNRIQVNMTKAGSKAILISDEGKSYDALLRRLRRHNYIPSKYGDWGGGAFAKNIPADLILEDLVYRDSARSFFIQAADFCAFALMRFEAPTAATRRLGVNQSFMILEPLFVKRAFAKDPRRLGIIRDT